MSAVLVWNSRSYEKAWNLAQYALLCGSSVSIVSIGMDRVFYGEWAFPPFKFVYFNVVQSLAVFYGSNRPDYYLTEGLPLLLTTALPFAAYGMFKAVQAGISTPAIKIPIEQHTLCALATSVTTSVAILSLIAHKEVRFIFPLLPMLHVLAAKPAAAFFDTSQLLAKKYWQALLALILIVNVAIASYTGYVHQRGVIDVVHYIRHVHEQKVNSRTSEYLSAESHTTVAFLMPCHSTPWRSHLVYPEIEAWALTCEPPLNFTMAERKDYLDEADVFYANPGAWIKDNMEDVATISKSSVGRQRSSTSHEGRREWPEYLAFFHQLEPALLAMFRESRYTECWRGFNTHWHDDWRRQGDVIVWCLR